MITKRIIPQFCCYCLCFFGSFSLFAQSDSIKDISTSVNVDLVSHYIWRGQDYGQKPSIQPDISVSWKDFTLGFWGAFKLTGSGDNEFDFYIEKTLGPVTLSVWDYWSYYDNSSNDYFNYSKRTTSHLLEAQVLLSGGEKLPFNVLGSYFFYGADPTKSLYFELQYLRSFGSLDTQIFTGYQAKGSYYGDKSSFVNLGCVASYPIKLGKTYSIPLNLSFILNPNSEDTYLVVGITILTL